MANNARPAPKPKRRRIFLKEWREHRRLTQEQLAERIGRTHGFISQLERGNSGASIETLEALAHALQCRSWDLQNVDPSKEGDVIDMTDLLRGASPEQRRQVQEYARFVIRRQ